MLKGGLSQSAVFLVALFLLLFHPNLLLELARLPHGRDLGLEKVLGAPDPDLVHVDLALLRQHRQTRVGVQFAGSGFAEDQQELAETDVAVLVLVDLLKTATQTFNRVYCQ